MSVADRIVNPRVTGNDRKLRRLAASENEKIDLTQLPGQCSTIDSRC